MNVLNEHVKKVAQLSEGLQSKELRSLQMRYMQESYCQSFKNQSAGCLINVLGPSSYVVFQSLLECLVLPRQ